MDICTTDQHKVCGPISQLEDAWSYTQNPPKWVDNIIDLVPRSGFVIKNVWMNCHVKDNKLHPNIRLGSQSVPRTLVCHDMKGGYIEDRFTDAVNVGNGYAFYRWSQIDIFVYFSHHLITIPPLSWINAAHSNGVKILGTFITEWNAGKETCLQIFQDCDTLTRFVEILVDICVLFKFDGWLLNIENDLDDTAPLQEFVKLLTERCHNRRPGSLIIWYDSIIDSGILQWQNELNSLNKCYFDVCDGIFLNYTWNEENLINSVNASEHRFLDVYVGVDVFGRNFYGGGKFNTYLAAEKIRQHNLSMAIFAQGWTHETLNVEPSDTLLERFLNRDNTFWRTLWPYLYTHPISNFFETFFYIGVDKEWFKLHSQDKQLTHFLSSKEVLLEAVDVPTLKNTCNCLQLHSVENSTSVFITDMHLNAERSHIHHLFSCNLVVNDKIIIYYYVNSSNEHLNLILLIKHRNNSYQKIVCHASVQETLKNNISIIEVNPCQEEDILSQVFHKVPSNWMLKCYVLNFTDAEIFEIGATIDNGDSVCLCGIGIKQAKFKVDS